MDSLPPIPHADPDLIALDFVPFFRVYKDGRVEKFIKAPFVPPADSDDPQSTGGVRSKDVIISSETQACARLYLPATVKPDEKLPVLIYIHGGAFVIGSAFGVVYHSYLTSVVAEANVVAVSVEYRLAPEHPIPACFDDSWAVTKWVDSHANRKGPEPWLNNHADFSRVFLAGDSAGGNIAHYMTVKASQEGLGDGVKLEGLILAHPFFGKGGREELWEYITSDFKGWDDPRLNPMASPELLSGLVCGKILLFTSETDPLRDRSLRYCEAIKMSGWSGELEVVDVEKEGHTFHILNPSGDNAGILMKRLVSFLGN
ncbi:probable carboxylesterase 12 [Coffea arabica]|uniref:Probable carboxylesterase 12 n=1 Tax=Coffea arabica TaxID=13443 RepID=A0A6P6WY19_COFAR|nr:probable carboxylesterase 12 [Coffea arabica]